MGDIDPRYGGTLRAMPTTTLLVLGVANHYMELRQAIGCSDGYFFPFSLVEPWANHLAHPLESLLMGYPYSYPNRCEFCSSRICHSTMDPVQLDGNWFCNAECMDDAIAEGKVDPPRKPKPLPSPTVKEPL